MKSIWKAFCRFLDFFFCFKKGIKKSYSAIELSSDYYGQPIDDGRLMGKSEAKSLNSANSLFITEQAFNSNQQTVQLENDPLGLKSYCYYGQLIYQQNRDTVMPSISEILANKAVTIDLINEEKPPESEQKNNSIPEIKENTNITENNAEKTSGDNFYLDDLRLNSANAEGNEEHTNESFKDDQLNSGCNSLAVSQLKSNTSQEYLSANESLPESTALQICPEDSVYETGPVNTANDCIATNNTNDCVITENTNDCIVTKSINNFIINEPNKISEQYNDLLIKLFLDNLFSILYEF
jgi:hypothetical protein